MSSRSVLVLIILIFPNTLNSQTSTRTTHAGGEILWIVFAIISLIIWAIKSAYKKVDKKVDDYKLSRNPIDIKTNEKRLLQNLEQNNFSDTVSIATILYEADPNNFLGISITGINNHEEKSYGTSKPLLKQAVQCIDDGEYRKLLFRHFNVDCQKQMDKQIISKVYYYYGHTQSMEGNTEQANKYKKRAKQYNKQVLTQNLY